MRQKETTPRVVCVCVCVCVCAFDSPQPKQATRTYMTGYDQAARIDQTTTRASNIGPQPQVQSRCERQSAKFCPLAQTVLTIRWPEPCIMPTQQTNACKHKKRKICTATATHTHTHTHKGKHNGIRIQVVTHQLKEAKKPR